MKLRTIQQIVKAVDEDEVLQPLIRSVDKLRPSTFSVILDAMENVIYSPKELETLVGYLKRYGFYQAANLPIVEKIDQLSGESFTNLFQLMKLKSWE